MVRAILFYKPYISRDTRVIVGVVKDIGNLNQTALDQIYSNIPNYTGTKIKSELMIAYGGFEYVLRGGSTDYDTDNGKG